MIPCIVSCGVERSGTAVEMSTTPPSISNPGSGSLSADAWNNTSFIAFPLFDTAILSLLSAVIPAQAGIQGNRTILPWMPAFAGMTREACCRHRRAACAIAICQSRVRGIDCAVTE
jgi:hypothetical protein